MNKFYTNVATVGNKILVRGYENGKRFSKKIAYKPYLFIPSKTADTKYKTIDDKPVSRVDFDSIWEARKFIDQYRDLDGFSISGMERFQYAYIHDNYPLDIDYQKSLINIGIIDIECDITDGYPDINLANRTITAISIRFNGKTATFGLKDIKIDQKDVLYIYCENEEDMLQRFIRLWEKLDLDVITGWNIDFFDIPYLVNRIRKLLGDLWARRLSPWKILQDKKLEVMGREHTIFTPLGITSLDYLQLYQKYAYIRSGQESYKESKTLNYVASKELDEQKLNYDEYSSLNDLYQKNPLKYYLYNIHDCTLVERLEAKLKFIEIVFSVAYDVKVNYADAFTTVLLWDIAIYNFLAQSNTVVPQPSKKIERKLPGAYVKNVTPGLYKWVVSFDLASLYPHLVIQYNISPDTFVTKQEDWFTIDQLLERPQFDKEQNRTYAANGCQYSKDKQGFVPALMDQMFKQRNVFKGKMIEAQKLNQTNPSVELENLISKYEGAQLAKKIQLNSGYGALANVSFRYFDVNHAEAITLGGRLSILWVAKSINQFLNKIAKTADVDYIIAIDTDSLYLDLHTFVDKAFDDQSDNNKIVDFLDKFSNELIQPQIENSFQQLFEYTNGMRQAMKMKREVIASKGIWPRSKDRTEVKKRYILNVWDKEGVRYAKPKLKIMGIEAVKSSTPESCRKNIIKVLDLVMEDDRSAVRSFIDNFKAEFKTLPFEDIASPSGVRGLDKYAGSSSIYTKGTPMHVKGALNYNSMLSKKGITNFNKIYEGDKIKTVPLKMPNPLHDNVISAPGFLPEQFGLNNYIDRDAQFQKAFIEPIERILEAVGYNYVQHATLRGFYEDE